MKKYVVFLLCLLLAAPFVSFAKPTASQVLPAQNPIAEANAQRQKVAVQTRAASYLLYPDIANPESIGTPEFFQYVKEILPIMGSAFMINPTGLVLTSAHEIIQSRYCTGRDGEEARARREGRRNTFCVLVTQTQTKGYRAKVIAIDHARDIAMLQIEAKEKNLPFLEFADGNMITDGEEVLTIGAPLRNANVTTIGYISNTDYRSDETPGLQEIRFIAPIHRGNSGGALVSTATGKIVGLIRSITAFQVRDNDGKLIPIATGLAYAIHVDELKKMFLPLK